MSAQVFDFLVVGAGIAGLAAAAALSEHGRVAVLEQEAHHSYHATGRSAAILVDSYGDEAVQALTADSRAWFEAQQADTPLLTPRGLLCVVVEGQEDLSLLSVSDSFVRERLDARAARELIPVLRADRLVGALYEPSAADMDVDAIQTLFLRTLRANGGAVFTEARVESAVREAGTWRVRAGGHRFAAPVAVNAAGAWANAVAGLFGTAPAPLCPLLRSAVTLGLPDAVRCGAWPMTADIAETVYFKPQGSRLMLSPADERPVEPFDAFADDMDIAIAIDRFEQLTDCPVARVGPSWAGIRVKTPDNRPIIGPDPDVEGLVWMAGFGGFGVQTAPAAARIVRAAILDERSPNGEAGRASDPCRFISADSGPDPQS